MEETASPSALTDLKRGAARLSAGVWAGLISGFVIGGIGSRLAMFVLRLTSDPSLKGTKTDDDFIIGAFTDDTGFLILVATAVGIFGGVVYLLLRGWLPEKWRGALVAAFGGSLGGLLIIRPDGVDFTLLDPLLLAVVMFIALPALGAYVIHLLAERFLARAEGKETRAWPVALLPLVGLVLTGPLGIGIVVVALVLWAVLRKVPPEELAKARPVILGARVAFVGITLFLAVQLGREVVEVLA